MFVSYRVANEREGLEGCRCIFKCDNDLCPGVSLFCVGHGVGGFVQWVASIYHWHYFSSRNEFSKPREIVSIDIGNEKFEVLLQ